MLVKHKNYMNIKHIVKIKSIEIIPDEDRYDLEVEDNHNFYANSILVHNCRCIVKADGMWSRTGKKWISAPHIFAKLKPLFEANPDLIFAGELYFHSHDDNFNEVISLIKKTKPTPEDLEKSASLVQYWIYDLPSNPGTFAQRNAELVELFASHPDIFDKSFFLVDTYEITSKDKIQSYLEQFVSEDFDEGVFEDFPKNGSLDYDILLSMETYGKKSTDNWLGYDRYKGYVKLMPGVDPNTLTDAIRKMQEAHQPLEQIEAQGTSLKYFLKPFSNMHTSSPEVKTQVILLSIVAALLIIISLLNYILIVISSMVKRSKEVGVRKCYGAEGKHIYGMLTKEALLHIVLSLALAAVIIFAGRGIVENLLGVPFQTLLVS